jgi:hypothetical protein
MATNFLQFFISCFPLFAHSILPFTEKFINLALPIRFCRLKKLILTLELILPIPEKWQKGKIISLLIAKS